MNRLLVNGVEYQHHFAKVELPENFHLIRWLRHQKDPIKGYWNDSKREFAILGSVLTLEKVPSFDRENESSARFWGGHSFAPNHISKDLVWDSFPRLCLFLPKIEIAKQNGKIIALVNALDEEVIVPKFDEGSFEKNQVSLVQKNFSPLKEMWIQLVERSLEKIRASELCKVVHARKTPISVDGQLDPFALLTSLPKEGSIRFAIQFEEEAAFIGSSPERLFRRDGLNIYTEAIAGTRNRGQTVEEDVKLEQELMQSGKEQREVSHVVQSISEALIPLCSEVHWEKDATIIKTENVQHLRNRCAGILLGDVSDERILSALHPTAATGGLPKDLALDHLIREEPFERGWYASPFGYCSQKSSEFLVAIRSALVKNKELHLFAGAGIIEGSIAEKEWEELEHKTSFWSRL